MTTNDHVARFTEQTYITTDEPGRTLAVLVELDPPVRVEPHQYLNGADVTTVEVNLYSDLNGPYETVSPGTYYTPRGYNLTQKGERDKRQSVPTLVGAPHDDAVMERVIAAIRACPHLDVPTFDHKPEEDRPVVHAVTITVYVDEMDGTPEQTAQILLDADEDTGYAVLRDYLDMGDFECHAEVVTREGGA